MQNLNKPEFIRKVGSAYYVPTAQEPTILNRGAVYGGVAGGFVGSTATDDSVWGLVAGVLTGNVLGGLFGKRKMEVDAARGKEVTPGSYWNRGLLDGGLIWAGIGLLVGIASAFGFDAAPATQSFSGLIGLGVGALFGAVTGSVASKRISDHRYRVAEHAYALQQTPGLDRGHVQAYTVLAGMPTVTMEEQQALEKVLTQPSQTAVLIQTACASHALQAVHHQGVTVLQPLMQKS